MLKNKTDMDLLKERMATDFPFYAKNVLYIATKDGQKKKFELNKAQMHIHSVIEKQKKEIGYVRVIVVKARQQGCSTYTAGRFYWLTTMREAVNAFVLSHASDTTKKLFSITTRYHDNCDKMFKPKTKNESSVELRFARLDSSYYTATAGAKEVGRGSTVHYFHGSEVAFWPNAATHFMAVLQAVPTGKMAKGTEVILESTANGESGKFYELVMEALKGNGEYEVIFTPWYWQDEYSSPAPDDWEVPESEIKYQDAYGVTKDQMYWRYAKTIELGSEWRFKQEFPANVQEAFQTSGDESFISPELVMNSVIPKGKDIYELESPVIAACDPGGKSANGDPTCIGHRTSTRVNHVEYHQGLDTIQIANECEKYINKHNVDRMFVDTIGIGAGVYDQLMKMGLRMVVRACNFSAAAVDKKPDGQAKYLNKRAECWGRLKEAMETQIFEIPNEELLRGDLSAPQYTYENTRGVLQLEGKRDMRKRGVKSPNAGDVVAMTYCEPVHGKLRTTQQFVKVTTDYDPLESII
jgi:hypothetical protein